MAHPAPTAGGANPVNLTGASANAGPTTTALTAAAADSQLQVTNRRMLTMADNLRERIAQTLHRRYAPQLGMADTTWDDEHSLTQEMWREDADAVIAELAADYIMVPKSMRLVQWADEISKREVNDG